MATAFNDSVQNLQALCDLLGATIPLVETGATDLQQLSQLLGESRSGPDGERAGRGDRARGDGGS